MTARDIQRRIIVDRYARSTCLPNYTPTGWFESDVFELTKAGYFREYEIKLRKSDFLADRLKARQDWCYDEQTHRGEYYSIGTKHQRLAKGDVAGPTMFWFVTPEHLVELAEVPMWAGLMWAHHWKGHRPPWNVHLSVVKPAPKLHKTKLGGNTRSLVEGACYYRYLRLFLHGNKDMPEIVQA